MNYVSCINSDFEKSDFKSLSNDYFKCILFVCDVTLTFVLESWNSSKKSKKYPYKILVMNLSEWKPSWVTPPWSKTRRKNMAMSAKLKSSHIRRISLNNPRKENPHHLVGYVMICTLLEIVRLDIISAPFVEKRYKETKCKSGTKAPSKNKVAAMKARPATSLSVVSSTYETDGINRLQYVILTINGQKVRLQLDTASDITLISRKSGKNWAVLKYVRRTMLPETLLVTFWS